MWISRLLLRSTGVAGLRERASAEVRLIVRSKCTAYARYLWSGYLEMQPFGRGPARHLFFFLEPRMSFGRNIPQMRYLASMEPIAFDRSMGLALQLSRNLELRATQHQVDFLGRYRRSLGPADLGTTGPYGLYSTFGVRWSFGGYGHSGSERRTDARFLAAVSW